MLRVVALLSAVLAMCLVACEPANLEDENADFLGSENLPIVNGTLVTSSDAVAKIPGALWGTNDPAGGWYFTCTLSYIGTNASGVPWAVTAAHCVKDFTYTYKRVHFGGATLATQAGNCRTAGAAGNSNCVPILEVIMHGSYAAGDNYDIALLKLGQVPANATKMTLASSTPATGTTVWIAGYGKQTYNVNANGNLYKADTAIYSITSCKSYLSYANSSNHLCVRDGSQSACFGDSGGPMFSGTTLYGETHGGSGTCSVSSPQVYTSIPMFRSWITTKSGI
jgi:secreted trypsin-like serine protease